MSNNTRLKLREGNNRHGVPSIRMTPMSEDFHRADGHTTFVGLLSEEVDIDQFSKDALLTASYTPNEVNGCDMSAAAEYGQLSMRSIASVCDMPLDQFSVHSTTYSWLKQLEVTP